MSQQMAGRAVERLDPKIVHAILIDRIDGGLASWHHLHSWAEVSHLTISVVEQLELRGSLRCDGVEAHRFQFCQGVIRVWITDVHSHRKRSAVTGDEVNRVYGETVRDIAGHNFRLTTIDRDTH